MNDPRAPVAAAIRAELPDFFNKPGNLEKFDVFLDSILFPRVGVAREISEVGLALIKKFEGCRLTAYPDPGTGGAPWTIGWGAVGPGISRGVVWTQAQADERLEHDMARYAAEVARAIGDAPTSQNQFDALVSFHYNTGAIARATLTKRHIAGDYAGAALEFGKWINAGGRPMSGLRRRRAAERMLYEGND